MNTYQYLHKTLKDELNAIVSLYRESKFMVLVVIAVVIGLLLYLDPFPDRTINIGTSNSESDWYEYGQEAGNYLKKEGFHVNIYQTQGSIDNLDLLNDTESDVNAGLAYGMTISDQQKKNVVSLGSIDYQPLWVFYRKNKIKNLNDLRDLAQYRVALGPLKSGSYAISKILLNEYGINVAANPNFIPDEFTNSGNKLLANEVDAFITVSSAQDEQIQTLLHTPGIALYSFNNAAGFARKYDSLVRVNLPTGSIDVYPPLPAHDVSLIATTTSLVVKKSMHPDTQLALIISARNLLRNSTSLFFTKRNEFPAYVDPLIPLSPVAAKFYDSGPPIAAHYVPIWFAGFVSRAWVFVLTLFAVLYPISKINLQIRKFQFIVNERPYYEELLKIEERLVEKNCTATELNVFLKQLDAINMKAIKSGVPIGKEESYFALLNSIALLRQKTQTLKDVVESPLHDNA